MPNDNTARGRRDLLGRGDQCFPPSQIAREHPCGSLQLVRILASWPYRGCTSPGQHRTKRGHPLLQ